MRTTHFVVLQSIQKLLMTMMALLQHAGKTVSDRYIGNLSMWKREATIHSK